MMSLVKSLILLLLVKLCIVSFALEVQGSGEFTISPSPAFFPVVPPREETPGPGPIQNGESWEISAPSSPSDPDGFVISPSPATMPVHPSPRTVAPSIPEVPNGPLLHPPATLPPPASAPITENITGSGPSISPSSNATILSPPSVKDVPPPSILQGQVPPSVQPSPPQRKEPTLRPPVSTPDAPAPTAIPSANIPKTSPVGQPIEHDLPPNVDTRNANRTPVTIPSVNLPQIPPSSPPAEDGSLPPVVHKGHAYTGRTQVPPLPGPVVPSTKLPHTGHGSLPPNNHRRNASTDHTLEPISPSSLGMPPPILPFSPVSQPSTNKSLPHNFHRRTNKESHALEPVSPVSVASSPRKVEHNPLEAQPISPNLTPPILPAPVTSPTSAFPVDPPSEHPVIPVLSPSDLPEPVVSPASTPSRNFNRRKGGGLVAPSYKTPKPLPAVISSPAQAPAAPVKQFHQSPEPLVSSHKSPVNKGFHSPASSPTTSFYKHHHKRNVVTHPAPASSVVSPPTSINQGQAMPPSLIPTSGRRYLAPPPVNPATPFSFPALPPASEVSHAPSPSFKFGPQPSKIPFPPKVSPSRSKSRKIPVLPHVQTLPPPPPNEDCLSTVCTEPYTNSPPGAPCRCVWPMQVGLRLGVSLYTFFPLVSELASEIASGVFMKQSQVRIMGAKSANQQPEKTDVLLDLVPLGENFDNTTAFLTSDRFWHKKVVIKASYFGDYEVLYVIYPGLPPSPPLPPSSITMIDGGPFSNNGNDGRTIKPLGVDIPKRHHKRGLSSGVIAIISLSAFVAVVLCSAAAWVLLFKHRDHVSQTASTPRVLPPSLSKTPGTAGSLTGVGPGSASSSFRSSIAAYKGSAKTFSMNEIERATENFHDSRILGEGGFGRVYSGTLDDGVKVAVKVLKREDHHGDREFLAEVEMLSRLHHRNLVKLIGICTEDNFRCLVYELIPNGSVESHLHGVDRETTPIDWSARMKIALGAARAPEYAMTGHLLVKSDVYSYGVVLLELLTGRKPVDMSQPPGQENLVAWARPLLTSKQGLEAIIDPSLGSEVPFDSVAKVAAIASMCVQPEVSNRPFMGEVVQALKLVCNECDEAKETCSRSSSKEDLSVDLDMGVSTSSGQLPHNFQTPHFATNYDSGVDIERGLSVSELFGSSARFGMEASSSFRRHSYSGPLRTGRSRRLWQFTRAILEHANFSCLGLLEENMGIERYDSDQYLY
ncbi:receptor-like serine/threonine-protein kinase ALE2 isoform X5 [Senna tora]|uniref:Receptor-like serine/threonine-protein kinase ALE2 isoform X5 n=1 Tax=Senna tora TaxID=362788 RepID=A0A834X3Y3_9FABA|nr:receptor-like serine/threonine-protein kinase ALE2 isoform X5 [Senna tora]